MQSRSRERRDNSRLDHHFLTKWLWIQRDCKLREELVRLLASSFYKDRLDGRTNGGRVNFAPDRQIWCGLTRNLAVLGGSRDVIEQD